LKAEGHQACSWVMFIGELVIANEERKLNTLASEVYDISTSPHKAAIQIEIAPEKKVRSGFYLSTHSGRTT
jgi:hypothetical protein